MGKIQIEFLARHSGQSTGIVFSAENIPAWLDEWLARLTTISIEPWQEEEFRQGLAETPFTALLDAIERARPTLSTPSELALYHSWIAANPSSPLLWGAWFNVGCVCSRDGDQQNAMTAYRNAQLLRPEMACTAINLGLMREALGFREEALDTWRAAMQPEADRVALQIQQGRLLEVMDRFEEAEQILHRVLLMDPTQGDVVHHWVHLRQKTCLWPSVPLNMPGLPPAALITGSGPLGVLALTDDIAQQRETARHWITRKTSPAPERLAPAIPYGHDRIRIGYLSSDFCSHAMSYLITELFERHDRARFEVFGYCSSNDDGTALRQRVVASFDHHRVIKTLSDEDAARLIRADEIDVLIDLNGVTDGSRLHLFRWRPAPIQATYLGFIGPIPMPELDYLLCDDIVIPPEHRRAYHVTPLSIGPLYQANDSKRTIGRPITRAEIGLPDDKFIFCCFTKHFKITEDIFAAWLEILRRTDNTVLWLASDNQFSDRHLAGAAEAAGIDPSRLIISPRADPDLYMSRLAVADLFLDTFPYGAGTVASDALRMELPIVTLCGRAFASRMATSLLNAMGAPEGITTSLRDYIETAIQLATDPAAIKAFKSRVTNQAWQDSIGNIARFTTGFEDTFIRVVRAAEAAAPARGTPPLSQPKPGQFPETQPESPPAPQAELPPAPQAESPPAPRAELPPEPPAASHLPPPDSPPEPSPAPRLEAPVEAPPEPLPEIEADSDEPPAPPVYDADFILSQAILRHQAGQLGEAESLYLTLLTLTPPPARAAYNLGLLLADQNRIQEAETAFRRALDIDPHNAPAAVNLGSLVLTRGDLTQAESLYRQAIAADPDFAMAHGNLGKTLQDQGRLDEAFAAYQHALTLEPNSAAVLMNLGAALLERKDWAQSAEITARALALKPDAGHAWANLANAQLNLSQFDGALESCGRAIALPPVSPGLASVLGGIMLELGFMNDALTLCDYATAQQPDLPDAHFNLSHAYKGLNQLDAAEASARNAIALRPDNATYHFHLGHIRLAQGELAEGWEEYEWRWRLPDFAWAEPVRAQRPQWQGEDISDKTLLIFSEQGIGDNMMFVRYVELAAARAGHVLLALRPNMRRLFTKIPGITIVALEDAAVQNFDVQCGLLSLPRAFKTRVDTIPARTPYLQPNPADVKLWKRKLGKATLKVGVIWAGNPLTRRDRFRSPGLIHLAKLFDIPEVNFFALQMGPGRDELATLPLPEHVIDLGPDIKDLADTAAIMANLDLVISSCTGPLHLAGALGVRSWAMLPFAPYFPWLLGRTDTPWYPTMKLYRQDQPGLDWTSTIERIAADLSAWRTSLGSKHFFS